MQGARSNPAGNVVCDLDGVVYVGDSGVPGAGAALRSLEDDGYRLVMATNNSTRSPAAVADRLEALTGYRPSPESIVTSSIAAATLLSPADSPALVIGETGVVEALGERGIQITSRAGDARSVVVGLTRRFDYGMIRDASRAIRAGARFVATNTDSTFPTADGLVPGAGALVAAVAAAAEVPPEVAGKPHPAIRRSIAARLGPGPTWMVGDRAETDLALAAAEGWHKVLVLSGVTGNPGSVPADLRPDIVVATIAELPGVLSGRSQ